MAKFSGSTSTAAPPKAPMATTGPALTHEGGTGHLKDAKTALFTLAVTNMVSETTFYEAAGERDARFRQLIETVTQTDPAWVAACVPWLRNTANMRSAATVMALEYAHAGGPDARRVVASSCVRPDEPAEALGYWLATYGRRLPMAVKRGIADAAVRLYSEDAAIKYDGLSRGIRMGDVLELCHPKPDTVLQSDLFRHLLDRRHGHWTNDSDATVALHQKGLARLATTYNIDDVVVPARRQFLAEFPELFRDSGYTWERLSGWLPGGMDAEAWEAIIPTMGYMALLRNLRNFEQAKVNRETLVEVARRIADPHAVAASRQMPYRFYSAYRNSGTTTFAPALEAALDHSVRNVPMFPGRTLVAIDLSGSMEAPLSQRSAVLRYEVGALFGAAVAARSNLDLIIYASTSKAVTGVTSVLRTAERLCGMVGVCGFSTNTWPSVMNHYNGHDRIVVFTDMQDHPSHHGLPDVPVYVWDLAGYKAANVDLSIPNRYMFGGFTDSAFQMIGLLESSQDARWPWE